MKPEEVTDALLDAGAYMVLPTGSRVIGGARPDSDWDFVVWGCEDFDAYLAHNGWNPAFKADGHSSWYQYGINLIVVHDGDQFNQWRDATFEAMHAEGREDRAVRVAIFKKHRIGDEYAEEDLYQHGRHEEEPAGQREAAGDRSGAGDALRAIDEAF